MTQLEYVNDAEVPLVLLHLFFFISISIVIATLPFAILIYIRILITKEYRDRYVYLLIFFNGITNILQFLFYIPAIHIGIFPPLRSYILYLNDHNRAPLFLYFFMVSISAQSHSNLMISFNRLISITHQDSFKKYERRFYWISLLTSIFIPLLVSLPILSSDYHYVERRMIQSGASIFRVEMSRDQIGPIPISIYSAITNLLAILSNFAMVFILWKVNKRKKENNMTNKDTIRVEKGLFLTTALNGIIHAILYAVAFMTASLEWIGAGSTLILFIAISSILPFWLLLLLVPSLRKDIPSFHLPFGLNAALPITFTSSLVRTPLPQRK